MMGYNGIACMGKHFHPSDMQGLSGNSEWRDRETCHSYSLKDGCQTTKSVNAIVTFLIDKGTQP